MRRAELEALALGLVHGPAELVPVSSSGHVAALPWLLGWEVAGWDGARRKELEVALHGGSAGALLLVARPARMRPLLLAAAFLPPAVVGLALERRIEERLGTPSTLAAGLLAGGVALVLADRSHGVRSSADACIADGLALGLAQAAALVPGVSRNGATLAAARARGFGRAGASRLSWEVALPVLIGASALKGVRVVQASREQDTPDGVAQAPRERAPDGAAAPPAVAAHRRTGPAERVRPLAIGAAAAFASTLATARTIGIERRSPLWPWALWRAGLAGAILAVRHNRAR
jgi:undecaprenyl-diphosphatase